MRPALDLTDGDVQRAATANERRAAERRAAAREVVAAARGEHPAVVAEALRACYALAARDEARELIAATPGAFEFDGAGPLVALDCHYRTDHRSGWMEIAVARRPGVEGPLLVAFPPGTYGIAHDWTRPDDDDKYGSWPSAQDLGLLRAPVIELREDQDEAVLRVEVACASFRKGPPRDGQRFSLARYPEGSPEDALALALCAGERKPEAEAQLALWLARNDIAWGEFTAEGGHLGRLVTFGSHARIGPDHARGAAGLLLESGTDPTTTRFFGGEGTRAIEVIPEAEVVPSSDLP